MSDHARGLGDPDEDRLPWLEPVDEEPADEGVEPARLIAALVVALLVIGLVVGGVYWLKQRASGPQFAGGAPGTIAAPPEPYKVKPAQPGGMEVKGQGDSSYAASEGADVNGQIDLGAMPEAPVARGKAPPPTPATTPTPVAPAATPAGAKVALAPVKPPVAPPVVKPAPAPAPAVKAPEAKPAATPTAPVAGGTQVQLGAFSSEAKANAAWKSLSGRFAVLAPLSQSVQASEVGGKTVYRLRAAAGAQASTICAKLKVAGETCLVVG